MLKSSLSQLFRRVGTCIFFNHSVPSKWIDGDGPLDQQLIMKYWDIFLINLEIIDEKGGVRARAAMGDIDESFSYLDDPESWILSPIRRLPFKAPVHIHSYRWLQKPI